MVFAVYNLYLLYANSSNEWYFFLLFGQTISREEEAMEGLVNDLYLLPHETQL